MIENNFYLFSSCASRLHHLQIDGERLKRANIFRQLFQRFFKAETHTHAIHTFMDSQVSVLNSFERERFIDPETGDVSELFIAVQKYNQIVRERHFPLVENPAVPELAPTVIVAREKMLIIEGDLPEIVEERRFLMKHQVRRYPGDHCDHGVEAASIFFSTQKERFLSAIGRIVEAVAHVFGSEVTAFQKYHYRSHSETDEQIYAAHAPMQCLGSDAPTSYWLGHASLLLNIPLKSANGHLARFNLITDPVEGDLNTLLYPRQTHFARPMETVPAAHIYLLSHNHLDHFDSVAIKKLVDQQPLMIVPKGDGERYTSFGFSRIVELDWWEKQEVELEQNGELYQLNICATPARHWAGQGPCRGHESTFLGYVIGGIEGGDLYFAGDTARLSEDHIEKLRDNFDIRWSFQPGGPDEVRHDMESTHQASVDALWMHFHLMAEKVYVRGMEKEVFINEMQRFKTVYMHTMTFKLGNLHLSDTKDSVEKVIAALEGKDSIEMKSYEEQVFQELSSFAQETVFAEGEPLLLQEIATLLRESVALPKIGSRLDLEAPLDPLVLF